MSWLDTLQKIRSTDWSQLPDPERQARAQDVVLMTAYASAATSVVPLPLLDLALLVPFHTAMVMTVGHVYGRPLTKTEASRVALELGAVTGVTFAGRAAITALKKILLPGLGGVVAAPASFALTWAFGQLAIEYFKHPELSKDQLKQVFERAMKDATKVFSKEAFDKFRTQNPDPTPPTDGSQAEAPAPAPGPDPETPTKSDSMRPKKRSL